MCVVLLVGFAFAQIIKAPPPVGEKESSPLTPNAPSGPVPRNAVDPNMNPPTRGLPTGAEVYDVMKIVIDPKTGKEILVPVEEVEHKEANPNTKHAPKKAKVEKEAKQEKAKD